VNTWLAIESGSSFITILFKAKAVRYVAISSVCRIVELPVGAEVETSRPPSVHTGEFQ
jgi:hypothetical protein